MMTSCTPFNKILFAGGPPSETQSEISSVDSDWSDIRSIALKLGVPNPDDLQTERFKVDRQKLENMIKTDGTVECFNNAEQFFDSVMKTTTTYISWPCRLKIGAKSKKDPHVRIVGKPEDVLRAKERILASLDSRGTRVIMKMDVSYTDHSYIIGRGGNNIKHIMEETSTHIHFPDSNRSNPTEKSNQVSLCGSLDGVEKARSLVRSSTPLLISFELPIMAPGKTVPDHDTPYIKDVEKNFNIQVIFSTRPKLHSGLVLVKGSEKEASKVQEATQLLINFTCENIANQMLVHMQLEISPQHHEIVKGKNNMNLLNIMDRTKSKIIFPDINDMNIKPIKKSQVTITGTIEGVYKARQQLIGNLPIALIFDYPESSADTTEIANLSNKYGVFISLRQKQRQSTMAVVVKGVEKFIDKVYEARHEVLKLITPLIKSNIPLSYFSPKDQDLEITYRHNLTSLLSHYPESPLTPTITKASTQYLSPYQKYQNSGHGDSTPSSMTVTNSKYHENHKFNRIHPQKQQNIINHNNNNCINNNNYLTVPSSQPILQSLSPRNSSSNTSGYQSYSSSTNSLAEHPYSSYGSIPSTSRSHYSPDSTYSNENKNRRFSDSGMHTNRLNTSGACTGNGNEYRSPHYDLKEQQRTFDFDMKRVFGFKAMERQPKGELRIPNSNWIGLGLSRTSPVPLETSISTTTPIDYHNNHQHEITSSWLNQGQILSPYNMGATTGLVESTPTNRRLQLTQHKDIHTLLTSLGLEHYIKTFVLNEIDLDIFTSLTEENLIELGITAFGARKKLLVAIHTLLASDYAVNSNNNNNSNNITNDSNCSSNGVQSQQQSPNMPPRFSGSAAPGAERRTSSGW